MKKIVIFLGPSLPISEAREILDAIYLPPAKQADLLSAVTTYKPDIIGFIDGVFLNVPSVWHKEILYALEKGVAVYGASSMGALRAVETEEFGMVGVGEIYRMYADGELIDDDEIVMVHGPEETGYRRFSEPMVNIRATFCRAKDEGIIDGSLYEQLTAIAKSIYFPERTFPSIFRKAATAGISPQTLEIMANFVNDRYVDIKRQDAIALLHTLRDLPEQLPQVKPTVSLVRNQFFSNLYHRDRTVLRNNTNLFLGDIAGYAALHLPDFEDINLHALNRALVQILAELWGIEVSQEARKKESKRFRYRHNLTEEIAFTDWLTENDLSLEEFNQLMDEMARCRHLQNWLMTRKGNEKNTKILLDELRLQNRYKDCADAAVMREQIIQEHYPNFIEENAEDLTISQLVIEHQRSTGCRIRLYDYWVKEAGFLDFELLKLELLRSHLARKASFPS
ncbi:MAG TPA: TfuA-related McrA-glycine thioamidation protein [Cyanobacteria bacterium UBA8553]|nr:TfuA-related McrA-glycine thioamidation protein [Cyanobacteria bacterium UBA8553]HAJ63876.1 TfuA-related McrA-glycine thioamidation protein [Cyanobacteria bacterium UBA8543]